MRFLALLLAVVILAGCAPAPEETVWYSFTDSTGCTVTLKEKPENVAVLFSSFAEVWQLSGGSAAVTVGESVERGFAPETAVLVDGGAGKTIDTEALLAAQPQLVIGSADIPAQVEACASARSAGIPAALFRVDTFADYLSMLKICTDLTENPEAYQTHGVEVQERIGGILSAVREQAGKVRSVLFVRAGSKASSTKAKRAPENFVCIMLDELGTKNIADEADVLLDGLSMEHVMLRDPDFIFISTMGDEAAAKDYMTDLFSREGWRELSAVSSGNWAFLPRDLFHFKPNARWDEAYRYLAKLLYPELSI